MEDESHGLNEYSQKGPNFSNIILNIWSRLIFFL